MSTVQTSTIQTNTIQTSTMQTFQLQTMIPEDGRFAFVFPEFLRGQTVEFSVKPKAAEPAAEEDYVTAIRRFRGTLKCPVDYTGLRDETDREI